MSRFWADGIVVAVDVGTDFAPLAFRWEQHQHRVASIVRRWRHDIGWWKRRVWRECFIVRTERGLLVELFRDVSSGEWRVQRVYD